MGMIGSFILDGREIGQSLLVDYISLGCRLKLVSEKWNIDEEFLVRFFNCNEDIKLNEKGEEIK